MPPLLDRALANYAYGGTFVNPATRLQHLHDKHTEEQDDFDVIWIDSAVTPEFVARLKTYQRVS